MSRHTILLGSLSLSLIAISALSFTFGFAVVATIAICGAMISNVVFGFSLLSDSL